MEQRLSESYILEGSLNLKSVHKLNFSENGLKEIKSNTFNGLKKLQMLSLWRNQLTKIKEHTFNGLSNLLYLPLWGNQLMNLKENTFNGLEKLKEFRFARKQIDKNKRRHIL